MNALERIDGVLRERGHLYVGESHPPRRIHVRRHGSIAFARLDFGRRQHEVVVKPIAANAGVPCPRQLCRIHESVRTSQRSLATALPRFYGFDEELRVVVLEYLPGCTLASLLGRARPDAGRRALAGTARILAEVHRVDPGRVGAPARPVQANRSYVPGLRRMWGASALVRLLPHNYGTPESLLDRLPGTFFDRQQAVLMPHDCQPKNVIVTDEERVVLIDIDYLQGNAAVSIAAFLGSLDRLALRHPLLLVPGRIDACQRAFVAAYRQAGARDGYLQDVVFFYPWVLLQQFERHAGARPAFRWFLARYYAWRLRRFLLALDRTDGAPQPLECLFSPAAAGAAADHLFSPVKGGR